MIDWDLTAASKVQSWQAPADILHFALSPDERRCVIMGFAGDVLLRDLTDKITTELNLDIRKSHVEGRGGGLWPTMISADGNVIGATTLGDGRLQLWRAPSWEEIAAAEAKVKTESKKP